MFLLNHFFTIESICDISQKNVDHCAEKWRIPHTTTHPLETIQNPNVELVFILTSDESHTPLAISAIEAGKRVFIEKPLTLSIPSAQRIIDAESKAGGNKVFVGYMRRYAPSYINAFKRELATIPKILYARCRDFSGPNAYFVNGSGTFQNKNFDFPLGTEKQRREALENLFQEAFPGQEITQQKRDYCRFLGSLGSHDISLLRETLGRPEAVIAVSANNPFYSAIMNYRNIDGSSYSVTYESGIDSVPAFDAHLAVYGENKRISIQYDSPYVKGLPIKVSIEELNEYGELQIREVLSSYEDSYTAELREVFAWQRNGKSPKTGVDDAIEDINIFDQMFRALQTQLESSKNSKNDVHGIHGGT
jgi:predicted dehydrogenase